MNQAIIETLEHRRLLAASLGDDGTLRLSGTRGNDRIAVFVSQTQPNMLVTRINATEQLWTLAEVTRIWISGGRGDDSVSLFNLPVAARTYGGAGDDTILGGSLRNRIFGGHGNDTISGGATRDMVYGDAGDDVIRGGGGSDVLHGGDGADTLGGDAGHDRASGGADPDRLRGNAGRDSLLGGDETDWLDGGNDDDLLDSGPGDDYLKGVDGRDRLFGGTGNNFMLGGKGDDVLWGGAGNDTLEGGGGDDDLNGEADLDQLIGGPGNDDFYDLAGSAVDENEVEDEGLNLNSTPTSRSDSFSGRMPFFGVGVGDHAEWGNSSTPRGFTSPWP